MKVHICYSRNDLSVVLPICERLRKAGLQIGIDKETLVAGEDFAMTLTKSIDSADAVIFFYSKYSEKSAWTRREIEYAISKKKKIVSILLTEQPYDSWSKQLLGQNQSIPIYKGEVQLNSLIRSFVIKKQGAIESPRIYPLVHYRLQQKKQRLFSIVLILFLLALITIISLIFFTSQDGGTIDSCKKESIYKAPSLSDYQRNLEQVKQWEKELAEIKYRELQLRTIHGVRENDYEIQVLEKREKELQYLLNNYKGQNEHYLISEIDTLYKHDQEYPVSQSDLILRYEKKSFPWVVCILAILLIGSVTILIILLVKGQAKKKNKEKVIKCFIAGSKALQAERDALRSAISIMYNKWATKNFRILSYTFEDFEKSIVVGGHQSQYNHFIRNEADWAIFVINGQIGGITLEEFQNAMTAFKTKGKPKILALAKTDSSGNEEILAIKNEIIKEQQYWTDYSDINSLKQIFETTLNWDLINLYM